MPLQFDGTTQHLDSAAWSAPSCCHGCNAVPCTKVWFGEGRWSSHRCPHRQPGHRQYHPRLRLTVQQGLDFTGAHPSVLRTIFGKGWDVTAPPVPFLSRDELHLLREVKRVRVNHNPTPGNAIETNAWAVRRSCNARDLQRGSKDCLKEQSHSGTLT